MSWYTFVRDSGKFYPILFFFTHIGSNGRSTFDWARFLIVCLVLFLLYAFIDIVYVTY